MLRVVIIVVVVVLSWRNNTDVFTEIVVASYAPPDLRNRFPGLQGIVDWQLTGEFLVGVSRLLDNYETSESCNMKMKYYTYAFPETELPEFADSFLEGHFQS